jgi:hypothetical protein
VNQPRTAPSRPADKSNCTAGTGRRWFQTPCAENGPQNFRANAACKRTGYSQFPENVVYCSLTIKGDRGTHGNRSDTRILRSARHLYRKAVRPPERDAAAGGVHHRRPAAHPGRSRQRQDHRAGQPHCQPHPVWRGPRLKTAAPPGHRRGRQGPAQCHHDRHRRARLAGRYAAAERRAQLERDGHHLYQQGGRGDEGAPAPDAGRGRGRRGVCLHLPLGLCAHPAPLGGGDRLPPQLYHLRHRRRSAGDEGGVQGPERG